MKLEGIMLNEVCVLIIANPKDTHTGKLNSFSESMKILKSRTMSENEYGE